MDIRKNAAKKISTNGRGMTDRQKDNLSRAFRTQLNDSETFTALGTYLKGALLDIVNFKVNNDRVEIPKAKNIGTEDAPRWVVEFVLKLGLADAGIEIEVTHSLPLKEWEKWAL